MRWIIRGREYRGEGDLLARLRELDAEHEGTMPEAAR